MISDTYGAICGQVGVILLTDDGGTNWDSMSSGTTQDLFDIDFLTDTVAYITGLNATILISEDAGVTWESDNEILLADFSAIAHKTTVVGATMLASSQNFASAKLKGTLSSNLAASAICVHLRVSFPRSVLLEYTNDSNFAGMNYADGFINKIRIPAIFWKPVTPQEKSEYVTTAGQTITPVQSTRNQMELVTELLPEYVHKRLRLIFMHSGLRIDGVNYIAANNYEYELQDDYRMAHGRVILTEQGYLKENLLT
jgi:hypothetical protein